MRFICFYFSLLPFVPPLPPELSNILFFSCEYTSSAAPHPIIFPIWDPNPAHTPSLNRYTRLRDCGEGPTRVTVPCTAVLTAHLGSLPDSLFQPLTPPTQGRGSLAQKPMLRGQQSTAMPGPWVPPSTSSGDLGRTAARWPLQRALPRSSPSASWQRRELPSSQVLPTLFAHVSYTSNITNLVSLFCQG